MHPLCRTDRMIETITGAHPTTWATSLSPPLWPSIISSWTTFFSVENVKWIFLYATFYFVECSNLLQTFARKALHMLSAELAIGHEPSELRALIGSIRLGCHGYCPQSSISCVSARVGWEPVMEGSLLPCSDVSSANPDCVHGLYSNEALRIHTTQNKVMHKWSSTFSFE